MPTLKQKSSFGPGKYRGIAFDRDRLLRYVEGTNKAIAAGVPIPLLDRKHAKPGATDKETADEADAQGVGWLTKLSLDANDSIEWEAKDVPQNVIDDVRNGHKRFTSPEFRDSYTNEKEGVYEGPIVRHITFTPLPGNPHQGELVPLESIALTELGVFQFSESDKDTEAVTDENAAPDDVDNGQVDPDEETDITKGKKKKKKEDGTDEDETVNENEEDMNEKNPQFAEGKKNRFDIVNPNEKSGGQGQSPSHNTNPYHDVITKHGYKYSHSTPIGRPNGEYYLSHSYAHPDHKDQHASVDLKDGNSSWSVSKGGSGSHYTGKHKADLDKFLKGRLNRLSKKSKDSQHAEDEVDDEVLLDEMGNERPDSPAETGLPPDIVPINEGTNPDMPPVANDRSKLQAVIAGLNQAANLVLPSDFDFANPGSIDILLAALNTAIKSKQEAEAEAAMETEQQEKGNLTEAPMPFSEEGGEYSIKSYGTKLSGKHGVTGEIAGLQQKHIRSHIEHLGKSKDRDGELHQVFHKGKQVGSFSKLNGKMDINSHLKDHLDGADSQHNETQFSESELAALTPKARAIVEKAEADRKQAEQEKLQFAENEKAAKQSLARNNSLTKIKSYGLPPYVVKQLTASMNTIQFSEDGKAQPTYTIEDVAAIIKRAMPASMMFAEADVKEADAPKQGQQFFEGATPNGHVDAATARQVVANNPMLKSTRHGATQPHASVASINEFLKNDLKAHPLNTMK